MSVEGAPPATQNHPDRDGVEGEVASPAIQSDAGHPLDTPQSGGWPGAECYWCGWPSPPSPCVPSPLDGLSGPAVTGAAGRPGAAGTPTSDGTAGATFGA